MIEYRKVDISEKEQLKKLIYTVQEAIDRKEFFVPFRDEDIDTMFDEDKAVTYGAYDIGKLIGTAQFYLGDEFVDDIKKVIGISETIAGEFGGVLILPEYRGKGIMKQFSVIIIEEARLRNYDYIVSVAHPENIASNRSILFTGAKLIKTDYLGKYYRNMYLLDLK